MKRKRVQDERRRPMANLNMADEPKLQAVRRKGCASLFGSTLLIAAVGSMLIMGLR